MENSAATNVVELTKRCTKCGAEKALSQFKTRRCPTRGRVPKAMCKACDQVRLQNWRKENPELVDAQSKRSASIAAEKARRQAESLAPPPLRVCSVCALDKPLSEYSRDMRGPFQKSRRCRACEKESGHKWAAANKDTKKAGYIRRRDAHDSSAKEALRRAHPTGKRVCSRCFKEKDFGEFYLSRADRLGLSSICKPCTTQKAGEWRMKNYDRAISTVRKTNRLRKYGLTHDAFEALFHSQGGKCGICRKQFSELDHVARVDHCHKTGVVRGLLCNKCNSGLGLLGDTEEVVASALAYIRRASGQS